MFANIFDPESKSFYECAVSLLKNQHTQMKVVCNQAQCCNGQEIPCSQCHSFQQRPFYCNNNYASEHIVAYLAKLECVSAQACLLQAKLSQALLLQQGLPTVKTQSLTRDNSQERSMIYFCTHHVLLGQRGLGLDECVVDRCCNCT